jgi:hypothetical protein
MNKLINNNKYSNLQNKKAVYKRLQTFNIKKQHNTGKIQEIKKMLLYCFQYLKGVFYMKKQQNSIFSLFA